MLLMLGYGALTLPGQLAFRRGLERIRAGDASGASLDLDEASQRDPRFAWYSLQAGFAHGAAALGNSSQLASAIERYATGIQLDPAYSLHRLNLAVLYWRSGDRARALAEISRAAESDPSALIHLNWGWMLESDGEIDASRRQYHAALDADALQADGGYATPHGSIADLSHSLFWATNPLRREALAAWVPRAQPSAYTRSLEESYRSLDSGDFQAAREGFESTRRLDPFRPEAFRGLGQTTWQSGEIDEARYYLQAAGAARGSGFGRMLAWLDLMELEADGGRSQQALQAGLRAFEILEAYNSWGMGSDHANPYAWGIFYRESMPDDLLPWVLRPDVSADLADRLLQLAELLDSSEDSVGACRVILRVLRAAPEYDLARFDSERLACAP